MIVFFQLLLPLCSKFLCMSLFILRCMSFFRNTPLKTIKSKNTEISLLYRKQQMMKREQKNNRMKRGKGSSLNCHRALVLDYYVMERMLYRFLIINLLLFYGLFYFVNTKTASLLEKKKQVILDKEGSTR